MTQRLSKRYLDCTDMTMIAAESYGLNLAEWQQSVMWWLGDLARFSERNWPDTHHQVWPDWVSPGLIARAKAVAEAYPNKDDRRHDATWTQFMRLANKPDRQAQLAAIVDEGLTTDESTKVNSDDGVSRWLLAVDVNYYLHRFWFSGAGVESAMSVASWVQRLADRLRVKNLTDVVCAFDSRVNHRKELTKDWEDAYKGNRQKKDPELGNQLTLVRQLLEGHGFCCVMIEGMEADDVLCSYSKQFDGKVTIVSADKDLRMALSKSVNILQDVTWSEDETSGEITPEYKWLSAKQHTEETGIRPEQWNQFQALRGDPVDGIRGCETVGEKGAADLIKEFGSAAGAIQSAKDEAESIKPKKREALIEFESKLDVTLQLVTLRSDLKLPGNTRI